MTEYPYYRVLELAKSLSIPVSFRSVSGGYTWNGKDLGLFYQKEDEEFNDHNFDMRFGSYSLGIQPNPDHPFEFRFLPTLIPIDPSNTLHDFGHVLAALDWARDLPEWGLWVGAQSGYMVNGGYHEWSWNDKFSKFGELLADGLLPMPEQEHQEYQAALLGYHFNRITETPESQDQSEWLPRFDPNGDLHPYLDLVSKKYNISLDDLKRGIDWEAKTQKIKGV